MINSFAMSQKEKVYIPPRVAWQGGIGGNPVSQLEHAGWIEEVEVERYLRRGVEGWTLRRANGERVLAVSKRTSVNPYGSVLVVPEMTYLPTTKEEAGENCRWIQPKSRIIDAGFDASVVSAEARASWVNT